ncbi:MAG TPA: response regulator [Thermoanaerobaculia bacterium]|nr:response regulator [Thermoanaerobaculia bacterium]
MARALIVDDDEPIRSMLAAIVRHQGFAVETAKDGVQAIESIEHDGYDVVLLDLMMPRVDGWTVLRYMHDHHPELVPRTIVATAVPEPETRRTIADPVFKIHEKPFEIERLISDVKAAAGAA